MSFLGSIGKGLVSAVSPLAGALAFGGGDGGIPGADSIHDYFGDAMDPRLVELQKQYQAAAGEGPGYQSQDVSGPLPEYDLMRKQLSDTLNQNSSAAQDAIQRRFAAMGGLNSGAAIKQTELQGEADAKNRADQMTGIGINEAQARRQLQEADKGRMFQANQNAMQRKLGALQGVGGAVSQDLAVKAARQGQANDRYQASLNSYTQKHSGGLLGSGGFLGTGVGA